MRWNLYSLPSVDHGRMTVGFHSTILEYLSRSKQAGCSDSTKHKIMLFFALHALNTWEICILPTHCIYWLVWNKQLRLPRTPEFLNTVNVKDAPFSCCHSMNWINIKYRKYRNTYFVGIVDRTVKLAVNSRCYSSRTLNINFKNFRPNATLQALLKIVS